MCDWVNLKHGGVSSCFPHDGAATTSVHLDLVPWLVMDVCLDGLRKLVELLVDGIAIDYVWHSIET